MMSFALLATLEGLSSPTGRSSRAMMLTSLGLGGMSSPSPSKVPALITSYSTYPSSAMCAAPGSGYLFGVAVFDPALCAASLCNIPLLR